MERLSPRTACLLLQHPAAVPYLLLSMSLDSADVNHGLASSLENKSCIWIIEESRRGIATAFL